MLKLKKQGFDKQVKFKEYHFQQHKVQSSTHAKLLISDGCGAYIGSGEIRKNSFDVNFEMGVILKGDIVRDIEKIFDFMYETAKIITFENGNEHE